MIGAGHVSMNDPHMCGRACLGRWASSLSLSRTWDTEHWALRPALSSAVTQWKWAEWGRAWHPRDHTNHCLIIIDLHMSVSVTSLFSPNCLKSYKNCFYCEIFILAFLVCCVCVVKRFLVRSPPVIPNPWKPVSCGALTLVPSPSSHTVTTSVREWQH